MIIIIFVLSGTGISVFLAQITPLDQAQIFRRIQALKHSEKNRGYFIMFRDKKYL